MTVLIDNQTENLTADLSVIRGEMEDIMTDKEAYELIGKRAKELTQNTKVQRKMLEIAKTKDKDAAEKWLYMTAVATLCGCIN